MVDSVDTCLFNPGLPECLNPMQDGSCDLNNCFSCDEVVADPIFKKYGGRTQHNSDIITTFSNSELPGTPLMGSTKRPWSTICQTTSIYL